MKTLVKVILSAAAILVADYILPGVTVSGVWTAVVAALVLGAINLLVRPIVLALTLPVNIITMGLFTFAVNAGMALLAAAIVPGFEVAGFWAALLFSLVISGLRMVFSGLGDRA